MNSNMDEVRGPSTSTERSRKRRELIKSNPDKFNEYKAMQSQKKKFILMQHDD
jgi:hypothetical protein